MADPAAERLPGSSVVDLTVISALVGVAGLQLGLGVVACILHAAAAIALVWLAQAARSQLFGLILLFAITIAGVALFGDLALDQRAAHPDPGGDRRAIAVHWLPDDEVVVEWRAPGHRWPRRTAFDPDSGRALRRAAALYDRWGGGSGRVEISNDGWSGHVGWHVDQSGWLVRVDRQHGVVELTDLEGGGMRRVFLDDYRVGDDDASALVGAWCAVAHVGPSGTTVRGYRREPRGGPPLFSLHLPGQACELIGWSEDRQRALLVERAGREPSGSAAVDAVGADGALEGLGHISALPEQGQLRVVGEAFRYATAGGGLVEEPRAWGRPRALHEGWAGAPERAAALAPDGRRAVVLTAEGQARVLDLGGGPAVELSLEETPRSELRRWHPRLIWLLLACVAAFITVPQEGGPGPRLLARAGLLAAGPLMAAAGPDSRGPLAVLALVGMAILGVRTLGELEAELRSGEPADDAASS